MFNAQGPTPDQESLKLVRSLVTWWCDCVEGIKYEVLIEVMNAESDCRNSQLNIVYVCETEHCICL